MNYLKMCLGEANLGMNEMLTQKDRQSGASPGAGDQGRGAEHALGNAVAGLRSEEP